MPSIMSKSDSASVALVALALCGVFAATACNRSGNTSPANTIVPPQAARPVVSPGDTLQVEVFGEKDLSGKFQVSEKGTIDYPLVGRLEVGGMTPPRCPA